MKSLQIKIVLWVGCRGFALPHTGPLRDERVSRSAAGENLICLSFVESFVLREGYDGTVAVVDGMTNRMQSPIVGLEYALGRAQSTSVLLPQNRFVPGNSIGRPGPCPPAIA